MSVPLVSVIMTAYNCEKYIKESLESIIYQTFKDFEIIIYDDASTDKTWQLAVELLKNNNCVSRMRHGKENVGCGEGRNRAIKEARGKYIAIQDADDISFRTRLEKEVKFLEENDDIFCVGAWADKMEEDGKFIDLMTYPSQGHLEIFNDMVAALKNPIIDPSCMYRREDFNKLGGYDGKWKLVPDFNLWARAAKAGLKFANLQEVLVHYRRHPNSVTGKDKMAVVREHFKMCKELF
jgi:glycosyltransferase involved in cell wall biosynthesis